MPSRRKRTRGQSVVELALIAPVFLILLLSALDLGRLLYAQITITNAAKEGALVASQGGTFQANQGCSDTNTVMCGVLTEADGGFVEVDRTKVDLAPAVCVKDAMYPASGTPPKVAVTVEFALPTTHADHRQHRRQQPDPGSHRRRRVPRRPPGDLPRTPGAHRRTSPRARPADPCHPISGSTSTLLHPRRSARPSSRTRGASRRRA